MVRVVNPIRVQPRRLPSSSAIASTRLPIQRGANPRVRKTGDVDEPEFGASVEPADDLAVLRVANEYGERAKVVVLRPGSGAETIADYRRADGIELIGHGDVCICPS